MRYSALLLLLPLSLSLPLLPTKAADFPNILDRRRSIQDFWPEAEQLVQQQLNLINTMQRAMAGPNYNQVEAARGRLFIQLGMVERFLQSQYPSPPLLCSRNPNSPDVLTNLTAPQRQVYCALYASNQRLKPVVAQLEGRLPMLAGLADPDSLPSPDDPLSDAILKLRTPVQPRWETVPDFPVPEPQVIGIPGKTANEEGPPIQPAIAPPRQTTMALSAAREQLLSALPAFPNSGRIIDPAPNAEVIDRGTYSVSPLVAQRYATFLAQPNTGISRVLPAQSYRPNPNVLRNRLDPTVAERFPFLPLGQSRSGLTPRFAIVVEDGNFHIPLTGLDYGFMVNLGEVSLENLNLTRKNIPNLSQKQQEFFLNYVPPNQLEPIQEDRLRLFTGKNVAAIVPSVSPLPATQAPIELNNTYLLRLIQFQLPEAVLTNTPISRSQRRYLDKILETPSSDVLVAFQPISQGSDGSYTVIWRLLKQFPDPQITDLDEYVDLE